MKPMQVLRGAIARRNGRLFLTQWVGNLLLMLLAAAWLQIPDSHSWQFAFSALSGAVLVLGFLWLYAASFRELRPCAAPPPYWESWLLPTAGVALFWLLLQPISVGRAHEALFAGYWNAMSPPWLRYHFGYSKFVAWQEYFFDCVQWLFGGLLLPLAVETCACGVNAVELRRAVSVYRHWVYWLCILVCGLGGSAVTWALADWTHPGGLAAQTYSVMVRLGVAYTLDVLLWCFLLALIALYLEHAMPPETDASEPLTSQAT